jgi:hypothetical protein
LYISFGNVLAALGSQKQNAPAGLLDAREHRARVAPTNLDG